MTKVAVNQRIFLAGVLLVVFLSFFPSLNNGFTNWDDEPHLLENPRVLSLSSGNVLKIFNSTVNQTYIPLTILSFAVEYHFAKFNPLIYHLDNLILHLAVVGLVYIFILRLGFSAVVALWAALLFGIHPMHVESVAWVTERKDVLYAAFYLLSLITYLDYVGKRGKSFYFLSVFFGLLSILAKPMALSLPLILFLCDWFMNRRGSLKTILEKVPYLLYVLPVAWVSYFFNVRAVHVNGGEGVLTWLWSLTFYFKKFLFPNLLLPLYDLPKPISFANCEFVLSLVLVLVILGSLIYFKKIKVLRFAFLFYFLLVFFLLRLDQKVDVSLVADRFMYLPSVGICLLFGIWAERLTQSAKKINFILLGLLVAALSFVTFRQCGVWHDSLTLWNYVIPYNQKNPFAYLPYYNRGKAYQFAGRYDLALADFTNALLYQPDYLGAYNNRAIVYEKLGKFKEAFADTQKALSINPNDERSQNNQGNILMKLGKYDEAIGSFNKALNLKPNFFLAYNNRGLCYFYKGQFEEAQNDFDKAIELVPDYVDAYYNRANVYKVKKDYAKAIEEYQKVLAMQPKYAPAINNLANVYSLEEKYPLAIENYTKAIGLGVKSAEIYYNRAVAYNLSGRPDLSQNDFKQALTLDPGFGQVYIYLGNMAFDEKNLEQALGYYAQAIKFKPDEAEAYYRRSVVYAMLEKYPDALADAQKAEELGYPDLQIYIAKLEKLNERALQQKEAK